MNTEFKSVKLKNGLCVKTLKNNYLHSINIGIYVRKLPESVCGIAHLVEHLFFRRLADIPQNRLYFETDKIGASLKASTYADFICFDITALPSKIKEAFNLISRIFNNFGWSEEEILAEKEVVKRQIEERYDSMYSKADLSYYRGTPKGCLLMGKLSDIDKMSTKRINDYKSKMFVPQNACIVLTGNFSNDDFAYCVNSLEEISGKTEKDYISSSAFVVQDFSKRTEISDKVYSSKDGFSDVCISFDVDTSKVNRYSAEFLFSALGYGVTSELSQRLREQKGLINEIGGGIEFSDYAGRMTFEYEVNNEFLTDSLLSAFEVLSQAKSSLSKSDIERNMIFYTENQYRLLDDVRELNFLIGWRGFIESEQIKSIDDLICRYKNITSQDVKNSANEILMPQNLVISVSNNNKRFSKPKLNDTLRECREKLEV